MGADSTNLLLQTCEQFHENVKIFLLERYKCVSVYREFLTKYLRVNRTEQENLLALNIVNRKDLQTLVH